MDKLQKKAIRDQQKRKKPGECQKYVRIVLDFDLINNSLGQELIILLNADKQLKYELRKLPEKQCIIWERSVGQRTLVPGEIIAENEGAAATLEDIWQMENHVVRLLTAAQLQQAVKNDTLQIIGEQLHASYPEMQGYSVLVLSEKDKHANSKELVDLQIKQHVNVVQVPAKASELLTVLKRYTKSIAEAPYKQEKSETLASFKKYLANDKKECVRVEGTTGFGRLWQQHLNRLPLVTLEVAETIIAQYSCPKKLITEYQSKPTEAIDVIANLKINRSGIGGAAAEIMSTADRRIGNMLSTKLHTLYNARDPNALL